MIITSNVGSLKTKTLKAVLIRSMCEKKTEVWGRFVTALLLLHDSSFFCGFDDLKTVETIYN